MNGTILLAFIAGLALGLTLYYQQKQRSRKQLLRLLQEISDHDYQAVSLPLIHRLRQAFLHQQSQFEQLQQQIRIWQQLVEIAPMAYLQVDQQHQLLWCNEQARQLLRLRRWQPGEVRLLLEVVRSYELDQLIEQTHQRQQIQTKEWVFETTDFCHDSFDPDNYHTVSVSIALKGYSYPLAQGQVGVFLENQQPLVELSHKSDRLFNDLTHELRTPLTSIRLVAEALQPQLQSRERRWVDQMLTEVNRLIRLVEDWLEISQLETKPQQYLKPEWFSLAPLIESAWETLKPLAEQKQLHWHYQQQQNVIIKADYARLNQVFLNLFDNAIKYSPAEGNIWVKVVYLPSDENHQLDNRVQINIIDQGEGLPESDTKQVFERLYQGDESDQDDADLKQFTAVNTDFQSSGIGLGLSITRQIVIAHRGNIQAKNHPETGGAWLQVELPSVTLE